jgi:hypothetical protein
MAGGRAPSGFLCSNGTAPIRFDLEFGKDGTYTYTVREVGQPVRSATISGRYTYRSLRPAETDGTQNPLNTHLLELIPNAGTQRLDQGLADILDYACLPTNVRQEFLQRRVSPPGSLTFARRACSNSWSMDRTADGPASSAAAAPPAQPVKGFIYIGIFEAVLKNRDGGVQTSKIYDTLGIYTPDEFKEAQKAEVDLRKRLLTSQLQGQDRSVIRIEFVSSYPIPFERPQ